MKIPVIKTGIRKMNFKKMEIYDADKLMVLIINDNDELKCKYSDNKNIFNPLLFNGGELISEDLILSFFKDRVFDYGRPDKKEILNSLGLEEYNLFEIIKKTHGLIMGDDIWIKFDDENLTWEANRELLELE